MLLKAFLLLAFSSVVVVLVTHAFIDCSRERRSLTLFVLCKTSFEVCSQKQHAIYTCVRDVFRISIIVVVGTCSAFTQHTKKEQSEMVYR